MTQKPKFMRLVRDRIRTMQYSYYTEKSYVYWVKSYIHFHNLSHPKDMSSNEVNDFLTHLAVNRKVSPATQNQALYALVFHYKEVLKCPLGEKSINAVRSKLHRNLPVALSPEEVKRLLNSMLGYHSLRSGWWLSQSSPRSVYNFSGSLKSQEATQRKQILKETKL